MELQSFPAASESSCSSWCSYQPPASSVQLLSRTTPPKSTSSFQTSWKLTTASARPMQTSVSEVLNMIVIRKQLAAYPWDIEFKGSISTTTGSWRRFDEPTCRALWRKW